SRFHHVECSGFRQVAFPPKPVFHGSAELIERDFDANFHESVGYGQGVVEDAGVREIPHAEAVKPLQGARMALTIVLVIHADLAGEHTEDLTTEDTEDHRGDEPGV